MLIVDWDVHHGNGTQRMFESTSKVMYISLHRHDYGDFFPKSKDGDAEKIGVGRGKGYTINIPWNKVNYNKILSKNPLILNSSVFYLTQFSAKNG